MEETNEVSKSNKIKIIVITALIFLVSIAGISYAYFTIQITGNDTASSMRLRTANMSLVYNDVQIVSGEYVEPGWTQTKTLTVTNNGNVDAYYTIIWRDLINEVWNGELVISATCSSSSGSCENISETSVPRKVNEEHNIRVKSNISIAPGVTHTYTLTALFKETGSNQNYNQNKYFNGTLNIGSGMPITDVEFFDYEVSNNAITITGFSDPNMEVVVSNQTTCGLELSQFLQEYYNLDSSSADYAAQQLCAGEEIDGVTLEEKVQDGTIGPEYYEALGLSVTSDAPTDIIIPSSINGVPVTSIGEGAFYNKQLTSTELPDSVTTIGTYAFSVNKLTSVVIPDSVTTIEWGAFKSNNLTSVTIPYGVTTIGDRAFDDNDLTEIDIPSSVTRIGDDAFYGNQLTSVVIPNSVTYLGYNSFQNNRLTSVTLPNSISTILNNTFENNRLESITFPSNITTIKNDAFSNNNFETITIPSNITSISESAFYNNNLESVIIEGKTSSSDFVSYPSNGYSPWGWKDGITCVTDNTSNVTNGCITWLGSGS